MCPPGRLLTRLCLPAAAVALVLPTAMIASQNASPGAATVPADRSLPTIGVSDGPQASPVGFARAYVLPINDQITNVTLESLERRIDEAADDGADLIVLNIDTPGGDAITMQDICTAIKNLADIHTVAWINPNAYSAGAIIALACDEIIVSSRAKIGDCQPIMISPRGVGAIPEELQPKVMSPVEEEIRESARRNGYNLLMCFALVQPEIEVFWVRNASTGERRFVQRDERDELFGIGPTKAPEKTVITKTVKEAEPLGKSETTETEERRTPGERVFDRDSQTDWRYVKSHPLLGEVSQPIVPHNRLPS